MTRVAKSSWLPIMEDHAKKTKLGSIREDAAAVDTPKALCASLNAGVEEERANVHNHGLLLRKLTVKFNRRRTSFGIKSTPHANRFDSNIKKLCNPSF